MGADSLLMAAPTPQQPSPLLEAYPIKAGISMAANLREAFATHPLVGQQGLRAQVLVDTPVMLVPAEEAPTDIETLYHHTFTGFEGQHLLQSPLPEFNATMAFPLNKDVKAVIDHHFLEAHYTPAIQPVITYLHRRSHTQTGAAKSMATTAQLYAYRHGTRLHVFSFQRNRLRFYNSFESASTNDTIYYILYIWKQLAFNALGDELYLCGDIEDELLRSLRLYLQNAYHINPSAEFNRAPITQTAGLSFDLMTFLVQKK